MKKLLGIACCGLVAVAAMVALTESVVRGHELNLLHSEVVSNGQTCAITVYCYWSNLDQYPPWDPNYMSGNLEGATVKMALNDTEVASGLTGADGLFTKSVFLKQGDTLKVFAQVGGACLTTTYVYAGPIQETDTYSMRFESSGPP